VGLTLDGNRLYVPVWNAGMSILDVTDPTNVTVLNTVDYFASWGHDIQSAASVAVSNGYAYLVDASGGVLILNVSNPASVSFVTAMGTGSYPWDCVVRGSLLYALDQSNGIIVWSIGSPGSPIFLGYLPLSLENWAGMDVYGHVAVVSTPTGFLFVDVTNPATMSVVSTFNYAVPTAGLIPEFFGTIVALPLGDAGVALLDISHLL